MSTAVAATARACCAHGGVRPLEQFRPETDAQARPFKRRDVAVRHARDIRDDLRVPAGEIGAHRLLIVDVRQRRRQRAARGIDDRAGAIVQRHRQFARLRHVGDLARLRQPAAPGEIDHDHRGGALVDQLLEHLPRRQPFAGGDRDRGVARQFRHGVEFVVADRLLEPGDVIVLQRVGDAKQRRQCPEAMQFDHDFHVAADRVADLAERLQRLVEVGQRNARAVGGLGSDIERPDLHGADAFGEQALGKVAGIVAPREQILVRTLIGIAGLQRPVLAALEQRVLLGRAHMLVAGAGVVDRHALVGAAAEQPPQRLAQRLPINVPERDVDGRIAAHLGAGVARADIDAAERAVVQFDVARVLAEQIGRDVVVDVACDRTGRPEGLAGADDAGIGMDAQPEQEREFRKLQRLDRDDLHRFSSHSCRVSRTGFSYHIRSTASPLTGLYGTGIRGVKTGCWEGAFCLPKSHHAMRARALVTGAAGGLGREVAVQLAARGCAVAIADINAAGLAETADLVQRSRREMRLRLPAISRWKARRKRRSRRWSTAGAASTFWSTMPATA